MAENKQDDTISQSQKLDSIGTLAGGVAHEFNNILTVIVGACTLLESNAANNPTQMQFVNQISRYAERATKLTQSLLAFSRRQSLNKQSEDVGHIITTMQDFLGLIIGEDILLTTDIPDEPLIAMIDRGWIELVLINLAANARDAMPHGGTLKIAVSLINSDGTELEGCRPGDYARITVSDTGEGIDKDAQQRIFEPFFTTKVMGNGAGLGLSMAYGIIRKHDGVIQVCSQAGEGTTFRIYLPLRDRRDPL